MKTLTPISSIATYVSDVYVESGYCDDGYVVSLNDIRCLFRYADTIVELNRGPVYPAFNYQFIAPEELSSAAWPITYDPVVIQAPFDFVFPYMSDSELEAIRDFMLSTVPFGDAFIFEDIGNLKAYTVRFASPKMTVRHQVLGFNAVTLSLVRA